MESKLLLCWIRVDGIIENKKNRIVDKIKKSWWFNLGDWFSTFKLGGSKKIDDRLKLVLENYAWERMYQKTYQSI